MYYVYDYDSVWLQQTEARQLQVGVLQNPCYHDMPGMASQTQGLRQPCHVDSGPTPGLNSEIRWELDEFGQGMNIQSDHQELQ